MPVVAPGDFKASDYMATDELLNPVCVCGTWHFYLSTCGHLYQHHPQKCGARKVGTGSAFCRGTSTRVIISNVRIAKDCSTCERLAAAEGD